MPGEWDFTHASRVRLDPGWPGITAPETEIRADPETLEQFGKRLQSYADSLEMDHPSYGAGDAYTGQVRNTTVPGLQEATDAAGEFGRWQTAADMEYSLNTARHGIVKQYTRLARELRNAGKLLEDTAHDYRSLDQGVAADLERAAGWDQVARPVESGSGPAGGQYVDAVQVAYVSEVENVDGYPADWILKQVAQVRGRASWIRLGSVGKVFEQAADRLTGMAETLKGQAVSLEGEWASETSARCQQALQRIAGTAEHLGEVSQALSNYSYRSAEVLQAAVSGFPADTDRSFWETATDVVNPFGNPDQERKENEVREAFRKLNEAYLEVNYSTLPGQVAANLPELPAPGERPPPPPPPPPRAPQPDVPPAAVAPGAAGGPVSTGPGSTEALRGFAGVPAGLSGGSAGVPLPGEPAGAGGVPDVGQPGAPGAPPGGGLAGAGGVPAAPGGVGPPGSVGPGPAGPGMGTTGPSGISGVGAGGPGMGPAGPGVTPGAAGPAGRAGGPAGAAAGRGPAGGTGVGARPGPGVAPVGTGAGGQAGQGGRSGAPGARPGATGGGAGARPGVTGGAGGVGGRPGMGVAPMTGGAGGQTGQSNRSGTGTRPGAAGGGTGARPGSGHSGQAGQGGQGGRAPTTGTGAGGGGRPGAGMAPMAGRGGSSGNQKDADRSSWLVEDDDPWRSDDDDSIPPPVIR